VLYYFLKYSTTSFIQIRPIRVMLIDVAPSSMLHFQGKISIMSCIQLLQAKMIGDPI